MDIPKDKSYWPNAVQCDGCGGYGCAACQGRGWVLTTVKDRAIEVLGGKSRRRLCAREGCGNPIAPDCAAVYCSNDCAYEDA